MIKEKNGDGDEDEIPPAHRELVVIEDAVAEPSAEEKIAVLSAVYGERVIDIFFTGNYSPQQQAVLAANHIDTLNLEVKKLYMQLGGIIVHGDERALYTHLGDYSSMREVAISRGIGSETVTLAVMLFQQSIYLAELSFNIEEVETVYTRPKAKKIGERLRDMKRQMQISPPQDEEEAESTRAQFHVEIAEILDTPDYMLVRDDKKGSTKKPEIFIWDMHPDPQNDQVLIATLRLRRTQLKPWARGQVEYKVGLKNEPGWKSAKEIEELFSESDDADQEDNDF